MSETLWVGVKPSVDMILALPHRVRNNMVLHTSEEGVSQPAHVLFAGHLEAHTVIRTLDSHPKAEVYAWRETYEDWIQMR